MDSGCNHSGSGGGGVYGKARVWPHDVYVYWLCSSVFLLFCQVYWLV